MVRLERKQSGAFLLQCKQTWSVRNRFFRLLIVILVAETDTAVFGEEKKKITDILSLSLTACGSSVWMAYCAVICLFVVSLFTCSIPASLPQSLPLMSLLFSPQNYRWVEGCGLSSAWKAQEECHFMRYWNHHAWQGQSQQHPRCR